MGAWPTHMPIVMPAKVRGAGSWRIGQFEFDLAENQETDTEKLESVSAEFTQCSAARVDRGARGGQLRIGSFLCRISVTPTWLRL